MNFKKITKRSWWLLIVVVLTPSFYVLANFILQDFYISGPGQTSQLIAREGLGNVDRVIVNNSSNSYFVPNKTSAEWVAFRSNLPSSVTVAALCTASTPCGDNCYIVDGINIDIMGTVLIGNQCWMTNNLKISSGLSIWNYGVSGSAHSNRYACTGANNNCVANDENIFYQKEALMPVSQYLSFSSTSLGLQGICPSGWRIPSVVDINELKENTTCELTNNLTFGHNCLNSLGFNNALNGFRSESSGTTYNTGSASCGYYVLSNGEYNGPNFITKMMMVPTPGNNGCYAGGYSLKEGASVRCMKGGTTGAIKDQEDGGEIYD